MRIMSKKQVTKNKRRLMTVREVQNEFLSMNIPKLRAFLNENTAYIKIGNRYYYQRAEVEKLFNDCTKSYEYEVKY